MRVVMPALRKLTDEEEALVLRLVAGRQASQTVDEIIEPFPISRRQFYNIRAKHKRSSDGQRAESA